MDMLEMKMNPFDVLISTTKKLLNLKIDQQNLPKNNQAMCQ